MDVTSLACHTSLDLPPKNKGRMRFYYSAQRYKKLIYPRDSYMLKLLIKAVNNWMSQC